MLDAACAGEVFTSPVPDQMLAATDGVDGGAGVLHIVKNYTGDVMNFEMAAELAAAEHGVEVVSVVTDDDVAVQDSLYTVGPPRRRRHRAGGEDRRRGGRGGPQPRRGRRRRPQGQRATAAAWAWRSPPAPCPPPASRRSTCPTTRWRSASGSTASRAAAGCRWRPPPRSPSCCVEPILDDLEFTGGDGVLAFVNGMGGTPLIELYLMYHEVARLLAKAGRHGRPVAGRLLHHQPRHGGLLGHAAQARRRAAAAVGRAGAHAGAAVGSLTT